MIAQELLQPTSIAVIGASNDLKKPGGNMLRNIISGNYKGKLYAVNPNEDKIQGIQSFASVSLLPQVDLAILAIPAKHCVNAVEILTKTKNTKGFIIISAGFGETEQQGKEWESQIAKMVNEVNGTLIGPNCIGVITEHYKGVFTAPIPPFHSKGCDLISSSGATAVFIMEAGMPLGISFANVFSVGNEAQTTVEAILEHMDTHFNPKTDPLIKLLYLESISDPKRFLKHTRSLIKKGAKIAAIKAGIVYCNSREQLLSVASIFNYKKLQGKNIAIITHAGGSAVMLADALSKGGLKIPEIKEPNAEKLKSFLFPGSSVSNPIDFLATGTAEQLGIIIDYCEHKFDNIDAMIVVFGSAGLFNVQNVYNVLSVKLEICKKPIFPVLPSLINAEKEIQNFLEKGHIHFPDEVVLGKSLSQVYNTPEPASENFEMPDIDTDTVSIRKCIDRATNGYLSAEETQLLLDAAGIPRVPEIISSNKVDFLKAIETADFPLVMKTVGVLHKSDASGVVLNVTNQEEASVIFDQLSAIPAATAVMAQPQLSGIELFVGVVKESGFGHVILCGLGGIFIEVLKDVSSGLNPLSKKEIRNMIRSLRGYPIIQGIRGKEGTDEELFIEIIHRVSALVIAAPEIAEMDINPLIGNPKNIYSVDCRIRIEK